MPTSGTPSRSDESDLSRCDVDDLVLRAQDQDDAAFAELMRRTANSSFKLALSILRDRQEAEDEVQNSYLKAWRHVGQFQREARFSTWISRIVTNQCLMRLRKLRTANFVYLDDSAANPATGKSNTQMDLPDLASTPELTLQGAELTGILKREIHRLPPILRHVLLLRDVNELPTDEVARQLSISVSAVKSRLLRARAELRNRLEKHLGADGGTALTV